MKLHAPVAVGAWPTATGACSGYLADHDGFTLHTFERNFELGPFQVRTWDLPHFVPNTGLRLTADGRTPACTGDTGPSPALVEPARDAVVLLAEATFARQVLPEDNAPYPSTAEQAGATARQAHAARLVPTHL